MARTNIPKLLKLSDPKDTAELVERFSTQNSKKIAMKIVQIFGLDIKKFKALD